MALGVGAAPVPSKKVAFPYPTKSTIRASCSGVRGAVPPVAPEARLVLREGDLARSCSHGDGGGICHGSGVGEGGTDGRRCGGLLDEEVLAGLGA